MAFLTGKWALTSSDNYAEFLKAIGVSNENRSKAGALLEKTGDNGYMEDLVVEGEAIKRTLFVNGQQHGETTPFVPFNKTLDTVSLDGRPIKVTLSVEGDKFVRHEAGDNYTSITTSVVSGNERTTTHKTGSVTSVRKFKKI